MKNEHVKGAYNVQIAELDQPAQGQFVGDRISYLCRTS